MGDCNRAWIAQSDRWRPWKLPSRDASRSREQLFSTKTARKRFACTPALPRHLLNSHSPPNNTNMNGRLLLLTLVGFALIAPSLAIHTCNSGA